MLKIGWPRDAWIEELLTEQEVCLQRPVAHAFGRRWSLIPCLDQRQKRCYGCNMLEGIYSYLTESDLVRRATRMKPSSNCVETFAKRIASNELHRGLVWSETSV